MGIDGSIDDRWRQRGAAWHVGSSMVGAPHYPMRGAAYVAASCLQRSGEGAYGETTADAMQLSQGGDVLLVKDPVFDKDHRQSIKDLHLYEAWKASSIG